MRLLVKIGGAALGNGRNTAERSMVCPHQEFEYRLDLLRPRHLGDVHQHAGGLQKCAPGHRRKLSAIQGRRPEDTLSDRKDTGAIGLQDVALRRDEQDLLDTPGQRCQPPCQSAPCEAFVAAGLFEGLPSTKRSVITM